jgi:hypothetical protein
MFDLTAVAGFCVVLLVALPQRGRMLMLAAGLALAFVATGMAGYLDALMAVSARPLGQWIDLLNGLKALLLEPETRAQMLANLSTCKGQMRNYLPCIEQPSIVFFGGSLAAALYGLASANRVSRAICAYAMLLQASLWFLGAAERIDLFGSLHSIAVQAEAFPTTNFVVLPFMIAADAMLRRARSLAWPILALPAAAAVAITLLVVIPHPYVRLYPSLIGTIASGGYKGNAETAIVRRLRENIALQSSGEFRGSVATHFGYSQTMSRLMPDADRYRRALQSPPYLWLTTQNPHQQSGLWAFDIPTFDEYGHMQTRSFYRFARALLSERRFNHRLIAAYELELDVLRMVGVRFILSDVAIAGLSEVERLETRDNWDVRLFLYQLDGTNVGTWSPTEIAVIENGQYLLSTIKADPASLRTRVLLAEPAPVERLSPLKSARLSFERGGFRFAGTAGDGWSLALLPVRFSHCWQPRGDAGETRLLRANYLMSGLLFRSAVDVRYAFDFGPLRSSCRRIDAADME